MSIKFDITGDGEFAEAMEKAMKQFPASAEKVLRKEARNIAEDLGTRVNAEAKGHHWKAKDSEEEPVRLAESFRQGKVIRSGTNYTVAVTTKAPHYILKHWDISELIHTERVPKLRSVKSQTVLWEEVF